MKEDIITVNSIGGVVRYVGSVVFSSTKLLHGNFSTQTPEVKSFCTSIAKKDTKLTKYVRLSILFRT